MKLTKDAAAGLLFIGLGLAAVWLARGYEFGTARAMGPGFMPIVLGAIVAVMGAALAMRGLTQEGELIGGVALRPLVAIVAAIILFSIMIRPLGLVASLLTVVVIVRLAGGRLRPVETVVLGVVLAAVGTVVFPIALAIPLKIWPWS